jgi:hypothetical protein
MTRKKLKISKLHNTKTKDFQSFQKKSKYPISPLAKLHTKKLNTPKIKCRNFNIPKFQNMKTKNFQSSREERHIPHFLTCETSHNFFGRPPK